MSAWDDLADLADRLGWSRWVGVHVPAPWHLRLKAHVCGCRCHEPSRDVAPWADDFWDGQTPTHHDRACCSRYVGTVNRGWSGMRWRR